MTSLTHLCCGWAPNAAMQALQASSWQLGCKTVFLPKSWPEPRIRTIDKIRLSRAWILSAFARDELRSDDIVLFTDAYDTQLLSPAAELIARFRALNASIVVNAEANCFPPLAEVASFFDQRFPDHELRYLNSGCYVGFAASVLSMLDWIEACASQRGDLHSHALDQMLMQDYFIKHADQHCPLSGRNTILLDVNQDIFLCCYILESTKLQVSIDTTDFRLLVNSGSPLHPASMPCLIHCNGDSKQLMTGLGYIADGIVRNRGPMGPWSQVYLLSDGRDRYLLASLTDGSASDPLPQQSFRLAYRHHSQADPSSLVYLVCCHGAMICFIPRLGMLTFTPEFVCVAGQVLMREWETITLDSEARLLVDGRALLDYLSPASAAESVVEPRIVRPDACVVLADSAWIEALLVAAQLQFGTGGEPISTRQNALPQE